MPNENCLNGMKCPECGSEAPFRIAASSWFKVFDDGTDSHEDVEWDEDSCCECWDCHFSGKVADFRPPTLENKVQRAVANGIGQFLLHNPLPQAEHDTLKKVSSAIQMQVTVLFQKEERDGRQEDDGGETPDHDGGSEEAT